ncbi:MAG: tRNA lysidine(34) synthetase TilS [Breznakibacter sp.]|nr:tRNA lysidine(34) synthetase TilS [Breznakibacter sp.]
MNQLTPETFRKELARIGFSEAKKILVAVSGGADSVALASLFYEIKQPIIIAHCNFKLRNEESDKDEAFVRTLAKDLNTKIHVNSFPTKEFAKEQGISIEMAARELRYNWFRKLMEIEGCSYLATGHHKNDSVETFFLNLNRGTGIKGLMGISENSNNIIRPLLAFSRKEVEKYLMAQNLSFRTDESNFESIYLRNKFRNQVIPILEEINPDFNEKAIQAMNHLKMVYNSLQIRVEEIENQMVVADGDRVLISQKLINTLPDKEFMLYEIISKYGFNKAQSDEILSTNTTVSGQQFYSKSHRLIKDRHNLIILKNRREEDNIYFIQGTQTEFETPIHLSINKIKKDNFTLNRSKTVASFDAELVEFPLTLRHWQQGDSFKPLGLNGFKKLSDFFIDEKFSQDEKESCWLLVSGDDIIWIVGHRIDDRFKVTERSREVLEIVLK